jgi:hypothetical protein
MSLVISSRLRRLPWLPVVLGATLLVPSAGRASDGGSAEPEPDGRAASAPTYYESVVGPSTVSQLQAAEAELPRTLEVVGSTASARYQPLALSGAHREWQLRIEGFSRRHERVDATYDMILVLPLPADGHARDAFVPLQRGVVVLEGGAGRSVPLIYGSEKIVLKRNVGLEKTLLPSLGVGAALPDLAGTGYQWTAWDAIVPRDAVYGDTIEAQATLHYRTAATVAAPDAGDPRLAAYVITWIPALPASVPPYAVRIDVSPLGP